MSNSESCKYCDSYRHGLLNCPRLPADVKAALAAAGPGAKLCFSCAQPDHAVRNCPRALEEVQHPMPRLERDRLLGRAESVAARSAAIARKRREERLKRIQLEEAATEAELRRQAALGRESAVLGDSIQVAHKQRQLNDIAFERTDRLLRGDGSHSGEATASQSGLGLTSGMAGLQVNSKRARLE